MKQKIPTIVGTMIIIIIAATVGMYLYQYEKNQEWPEAQTNRIVSNSDKTFCTQEAKECSDGSYVGRTGPNCEFTPCPNENLVGNDKDEHGCIGSAGYSWCEEKQKCLRSWEESCDSISNWKKYNNSMYGFEIRYPENYSIFNSADQKSRKTIAAKPNSKMIYITDKPEMFFCCEPTYIKVEVLDTLVTDPEKWLRDKGLLTSENNYRIKKVGYEDFAGERAYKLQAECGIDSPRNILLINHNSRTYFIRYDSQDCLPLSESIIDTFKFTN